jgi:hypothetical protein
VVQTGTVLDANMGPDAATVVLCDNYGENWNHCT